MYYPHFEYLIGTWLVSIISDHADKELFHHCRSSSEYYGFRELLGRVKPMVQMRKLRLREVKVSL